jgi:hypothetical protein
VTPMLRLAACTATALLIVLVLAACGGDDADDAAPEDVVTETAGAEASPATDEGSAPSGGGAVVDPPPPGEARAVVDGQTFEWATVGTGCSIAEGEFSFGFQEGDDLVLRGGGFFLGDDAGWGGEIVVDLPGNEGYRADLQAEGVEGLALDGASMSYSGPMTYSPPFDGTAVPEAEDVGDGTVSVTCP